MKIIVYSDQVQHNVRTYIRMYIIVFLLFDFFFVKALSDYEALEKSFGEFHNRYFKLKECSEAYKKVLCTYVHEFNNIIIVHLSLSTHTYMQYCLYLEQLHSVTRYSQLCYGLVHFRDYG